jgi:DNA-3-methyladenine glycosylase II
MKELCTNDEINRTLTERDPALGALIARTGYVRIALRDDCYAALLTAIVEQQLSGRVAEVIWNRLKALLDGDVRPEKLLAIPDTDLRAIGMSNAKARYARALSEAVAQGALRLDELEAQSDEEIVRQLTVIKGIGSWTAEMFLIFSLGRPDVFSCGDGGLQRAARWLYGVEPTRANLLEVSSRWKPYRTYASLYLWEALNQKFCK